MSQDNYQRVIMDDQELELVKFDFDLTRRGFVQLGAGVILAIGAAPVLAQPRGRGGRGGEGGIGGAGAADLSARLHIGADGIVTVMTGKVEGGQGARAEITQAAAEELALPTNRVRLIMADTAVVPNDGGTVGSQTTGNTLPPVRRACAMARNLLLDYAAKAWNMARESLAFRDGAVYGAANRTLGYGDFGAAQNIAEMLKQSVSNNVQLIPTSEWKVMGNTASRPNGRDLVTGAHQYPSSIIRPGMLYGKVLRAPAHWAKLTAVDLEPAKAMDGVVAVKDGDFVAVAAPTTYQAKRAIKEIEKTAKWDRSPHPSSLELPKWIRAQVQGGVPTSPFTDELKSAAKAVRASYDIAYVQHTPMEPRAAVAEWNQGKLAVWTATQQPFGVRSELARALNISEADVRVIVPDFGGGFGGKHTGECAVEAARLARSAGKPVALHWTREEEFTWAYFRPAAAIDMHASVDADGMLTSWHFININSGNQSLQTPYRVPRNNAQYMALNPPALRHGSYRALASTANTFAREGFMDELAHAAGKDPLEFRLAHLDNPRLRAVLEEAAKRFDWADRRGKKEQNVGVGIACGTDKGSFVATCAEVSVDLATRQIKVRHICQAFECGAIVNPSNLLSQVHGAIIQGLGPALREAMDFEGGIMLNASMFAYKPPRFADVPSLDIHLLNRSDLPSAGAGETPVIALAPAIANAIFSATAKRIRQMPIKLESATA